MHPLIFSALIATTTAQAETLQEAATAVGVAWPPPKVWIEIDKSEGRLTAYSGETPLKQYTAGFGDPTGDKVRQGDLKTPTGTFRVVTRNDKSAFHLFLGLSYPDADDAARGLRDGLITQGQHDQLVWADANKRLPNWNTTLGGAVGIHGGGGQSNWTLGCIAVTNAEIEELWAVTRHGTRVVITE